MQYTDKLNGALTKLRADPVTKHLAKMGIDQLLQHLDDVPEQFRKTVRNAGGGYVNHDLFFRCMGPDGGGDPQSASLVSALNAAFGTVDVFKKLFALAALELFGSGWACGCGGFRIPSQRKVLIEHPNSWQPPRKLRTRVLNSAGLVCNAAGALTIKSTPNQDTPAMEAGAVPILGLDV